MAGNEPVSTFRMTTEGGDQVERQLNDIGKAGAAMGDAVAEGMAAASAGAKQAGIDLDALERAAERAEKRVNDTKVALDRAQAKHDAAVSGADQRRDAYQSAMFGGSARVFQPTETIAQQKMYQAAAQQIADTLDPVSKLQRDHNAALEQTEALLKRGAISQQQYDAYVGKLKADLVEATNALRQHGGVLGLNRMQYLTAQSAVLRFSDSIIAGQSPIRAFALEAHKVVEVLAMDEGGMAGGLGKVAALINPVTIGIAALTVGMIGAGVAAYDYARNLDMMEAAAAGFGRTSQLTGGQLMQLAEDNAAAGQVTVGTAREIEAAILQQTRTSADAMADAIQITQKFADAMGVDAKKAAEDLGKAMADPAKGADDLAEKYGYLTQAQVEEIHQLMEQNRLVDAQQALLADLGHDLDKAGDHVTALTRNFRELKAAMAGIWDDIGHNVSKAYDQLTGQESRQDRIEQLKAEIAQGHNGIDGLLGPAGEKQALAAAKAELDRLLKQTADAQSSGRANQLGQQSRSISAKYGQDPTVNPKLEELKHDLSTLQEAQRAGQKVDATTVDALRHAVRTFLTPEQQRVAVAQATADLRRAAPHSADRQAAGQRLADAKTAGQVITEASARDIADARGEAALGHAGNAGAKHAETLARQAESMDAAAAASLRLADAYLQSGAAALKAEAYRKAATDATRKGIDIEEQAKRQLNLQVAEQVATAAKGVRSAEDDATARNHVADAVRAGLTPARDMEQALARENALRPLVTLQSVAQGEALARLTEVLRRYRQAMDDSDVAQRHFAAQQAINAANDNARADRLRERLAGVQDPALRARMQAQAEGEAKGQSMADIAANGDAQAGAAGAKQRADSAEWLAKTQRQIENQRQLAELQAQYAAVKDPADVEEILRLQLKLQLQDQNIQLSDKQIAGIIAEQQANKDLTDQIHQQQQAWQQLRGDGANALDQLLSPDGIEHWGSTFRSEIRQILTDLEKLAVLNPLENMLFGGSRATLGGGGGLLSSLFGGLGGGGGSFFGAGATSSALDSIGSIDPLAGFSMPAFANGTDSAPGGPALVGEEGPEIVNLPRGAGVMTARDTRSALQSASGNTFQMPITINAQGAGPREVDMIRAELQQLRRDMPTIAVQASADAKLRRIIR